MRFIPAAVLLILIAPQVWPQQIPSDGDIPAWKRTLSATSARSKYHSTRDDPKLIFTDEHTLVAYQTIKSLAFSQSGESPSYVADLQLFQAESGTPLSHPTFAFLGLRSLPETSLYSVAGGVLLQTGHWVRFLTRDAGSILQELPPPHLAPNDPAASWYGGTPSYVYVATSLTGKTFVLQYDYGPHSILQQYNGQTLALIRQWEIEAPGHQRISIDDTSFFVSREPDLNPIYMTPLGGQLTTPLPRNHRWVLIDDDHWLSRDQVPPLKAREAVTGIQLSRNHAVIALQLERVGRCCPSLDIDPPKLDSRTVVYTYSGAKVLLNLPSSNKRDRAYALALSPDGTKLAILDGDQLAVYLVPAPN
jgi:hypothetical protein